MASEFFKVFGPGFTNLWAPSRKFSGNSSLLLGQTATRLRMGEYLEFDADGNVGRGSGDGTVIGGFYFSETGRGDIVTGGKVPVIIAPTFEAESKMIALADDGTPDSANDGSKVAFSVGMRLCVDDCYAPDDLDNKVYRGLRAMTDGEIGAGTILCVGIVTKVLSDSIRFLTIVR